MWFKWFPWRFAIRYLAKSHGFLDPLLIMGQLRRFAQPSEVTEPIELLRAGMVFHARGLINSRAIQHNLDWVWPYWVERQFDPNDTSFIPRAFSLTHINLTHRNWTAVGVPNSSATPIVDPRGLITPLYDSWSIDTWVIGEDGVALLPSRLKAVDQRLSFEGNLAVETRMKKDGMRVESRVEVEMDDGRPVCVIRVTASADSAAWLALSLRPYNPEGVNFIHEFVLKNNPPQWVVNKDEHVFLSEYPDRQAVSDYGESDVYLRLPGEATDLSVECDVGLATGAALYRLENGSPRTVTLRVPLHEHEDFRESVDRPALEADWSVALANAARLRVPDAQYQFLYDAALHTLLIHTSGDAYPGPYTYKRFWFRDAAFIVYALLCTGYFRRAELILDRYPSRQTAFGYFHSQEGEWDSNGEALWILRRFCDLTGRKPKAEWRNAIGIGARWIHNKRLTQEKDAPHAGLLPAGFSAEHLGTNDFYYWDDFWGVEGLRSASRLVAMYGDDESAARFEDMGDDFLNAIEVSLEKTRKRLGRLAIPASPHRRMDDGAIGSLVGGYPLQILEPNDPRLLDTLEFLEAESLVQGGFFQDMIHSGINPYLTLHMAQVHLRAGDPRFAERIDTVAGLASPTGQWPEAIHPLTHGGCMGDGQHAWAAAEWLLMMRNCFVREEEPNRLYLCQGVFERWLEAGEPIKFGPAPTTWGTITVSIIPVDGRHEVRWDAQWRGDPPEIVVALPGREPVTAAPGETSVGLELSKTS